LAYKYLLSGSPTFFQSSADGILSDFQEMLNEYYDAVPGAYVVQEESVFGSQVFSNVDVRVNHAIDSQTGMKLGDDWKRLLFVSISHSTGLGYLYQFDNNYWLVVFSEIIKNFAGGALVRRCTNMFRWADENGNIYSEPGILEYKVSRPKESFGASDPIPPEGYIEGYLQLNDRTRLIKGSHRFIFGEPNNRICLKIFAGGVRSFLNQQTSDDTTGRLLMLTLGTSTINEESDDLVNGIADGLKYQYALSVTPSSITGNAGTSIQLNPTLTLNGNLSNKPLTYATDGSLVAIVSASGLVNLVSSGSCNISVSMLNNSTISAIIPASVVTLPIQYSEVVINPVPSVIYEGSSGSYTTYLYINGVQQPNTFTYAVSGSLVPAANYTLKTTNNSITINNIHNYMNNDLVINANSGSYTGTISVQLRGPF
jgi:hypothetical protein